MISPNQYWSSERCRLLIEAHELMRNSSGSWASIESLSFIQDANAIHAKLTRELIAISNVIKIKIIKG